MSDLATAEQRLLAVAGSAAVRWRSDPVLVESYSNDTWLFDEPSRGPAVLRVGWRGDRGRLVTEAKVGRALPRAVGYPEVLGFGWTRDEADLTWSLTRRLDGCTLLDAWPGLTAGQRQDACHEVARRLRLMHAWRPSGAISDRLLTWSRDDSRTGIVGATLNPLPYARLARLATDTDHLGTYGAEQVRRAAAWLAAHPELGPPLDRPGLAVTHGDLHLGQVWWDGSRVSGLLDLEWVRFAPAWTDLGQVADNADADRADGHDEHGTLLAVLEVELGQGIHDLADRLRYWRIAGLVRALFVWPPHDDDSPTDHPATMIDPLLP